MNAEVCQTGLYKGARTLQRYLYQVFHKNGLTSKEKCQSGQSAVLPLKLVQQGDYSHDIDKQVVEPKVHKGIGRQAMR